MKTSEIVALSGRLSDAYSYDRYGSKGWTACVRLLAKRGYDAREIEAIMRSKWTRWAGDMSNKPYGKCNSADLARFLDKGQGISASEVADLVRETFDDPLRID